MVPQLRHEADAVVECRHVGRRAEIEVVRDRADGVGDGENRGEVVGVTVAGIASGAFERVGLVGGRSYMGK
jgi:hypothetical protein